MSTIYMVTLRNEETGKTTVTEWSGTREEANEWAASFEPLGIETIKVQSRNAWEAQQTEHADRMKLEEQITLFPRGQRVTIFTSEYSNKTKENHLIIASDRGDTTAGNATCAGVYIEVHQGGPRYGIVARLVRGIDSAAAFVAEAGGDSGGRDWSMASGSYIEVRDNLGKRHLISLHNRYEVNGGYEEGLNRRA